MAFKGPDLLYLTNGDYYLDGYHSYDAGIQSDNSDYGKIVEINLKTGKNRIFSKGHRNVQGLSFDKKGSLWAVEHGLKGGNELNFVEEGDNFGWPEVSLGTLYNGQPIPNGKTYGQHEGFKKPAFAWLPSVGISSLTAISGLDPSWDGDLIAGSLSSEKLGRSLFHIRTEGDRVVFVERIEIGARVRSIKHFGGDKIVVWLDSNELIIFVAKRRSNPLKQAQARVLERFGTQLGSRINSALDECSQCHSFSPFENASAPSLYGVMGRRIGSAAFLGYSPQLSNSSALWNDRNIADFLANPDKFAAGTTMPATGISDPAVINGIVYALE